MPLDLLNVALIAHIFQWLEIQYTLIYLINIGEDEESSEAPKSPALGHSKNSSSNINLRSTGAQRLRGIASLAQRPDSLKVSVR